MGKRTDEEMVALIEDTLSNIGDHDDWDIDLVPIFGPDAARPRPVESVVPIFRGEGWQSAALTAWSDLTGETELPEWLDDLTTITEFASRAGVPRAIALDALDRARYSIAHGRHFSGFLHDECLDLANIEPLTWHDFVDERQRLRAILGMAAAIRRTARTSSAW